MSSVTNLQPRRPRFANRKQADFFRTLRQRVDEYFSSNNIEKTANTQMVVKTVSMLAMYLIPFIALLTLPFTAWWQTLPLWFMMGVGLAGVGFSVMHDAAHGAYSKKRWVNELLASSMYLLGGNVFTWKVKHNVLHHTYTNIHDIDEDIESKVVIRMCPHAKRYSFHRYQHIYGGILYSLLTFVMILADFKKMYYYTSKSFRSTVKSNPTLEFTKLVISKILYFLMILALPMWILPFAWWQVFLGFTLMHLVSGFILSIVFQMAHVVEETDFPMPDENNNLENSWAIHQLHTTSDFARGNALIGWFVGGLNYQVEHHLFPNICHIHYPALSAIVEKTAHEYNVPYHEHKTFGQAIISHWKTMRRLGRE